MINQFIVDLESLCKNYQPKDQKYIEFRIVDVLSIFYDYCVENDNILQFALKYMIDNNKLPLYQNNIFLWESQDLDPFYEEDSCWLLPKELFGKMYGNNDFFSTSLSANLYSLLLDLANGLTQ